jgi:micrococcal nuclease
MSKSSWQKPTKRTSKRLLLSLLTLLFALIANQYPEILQFNSQAPPGFYQVTYVSDGDTIEVLMNGQKETIRYIGVDTPETHDPRKPVQCFGRRASQYNKDLLGQHPVRLEADPLSTNRDRYDRLLRYVYLPDGRLVQAEIIKNGYGFAYTSFPFTKSEDFIKFQKEARQQQLGLWNSCEPEENDYGGYDSNPER